MSTLHLIIIGAGLRILSFLSEPVCPNRVHIDGCLRRDQTVDAVAVLPFMVVAGRWADAVAVLLTFWRVLLDIAVAR